MIKPSFKFTGEPKLPKADGKKPFCNLFEKDGKKMASMNFGVKESDSNMGFVECFGMIPKNKTIRTKDNVGNDIEIPWDDRFNEENVKMVAFYRKSVVDLGEEFGGRKEFISQYDAILFLKENLPKYNGKILVTGQMAREPYEGKYFTKFQFTNVYAVDEQHKNSLIVTLDIYYKKDSIDESSWKENKVLTIDGYIPTYIKDEGKEMLVPQSFVFNASKIDPENEKHVKLLNYKLKYIKITNKKYAHLMWECRLKNGAEEVEFDESQLTPAQKEQIELGIRTLDDFKPKGQIFGEKTTEFRLFAPVLTGDFVDGIVDCDMKDSEFDELVYAFPTKEKLSDVVDKAEKKENEVEEETTVEIEEDIDEEDLFA